MQTGLEDQLGLYQKRIPIFTRSVKGNFRRFKTAVLVLAYAIFFLLPWLPWSRVDAPSQAVLFDVLGRRFLIFGLTVYPQDVIWLALLLFIAAILLFFVTGLVGRAFCGYFCFQTLWTDFFIWIESKIQGERPARVRLFRLRPAVTGGFLYGPGRRRSLHHSHCAHAGNLCGGRLDAGTDLYLHLPVWPFSERDV